MECQHSTREVRWIKLSALTLTLSVPFLSRARRGGLILEYSLRQTQSDCMVAATPTGAIFTVTAARKLSHNFQRENSRFAVLALSHAPSRGWRLTADGLLQK